MSKYIKNLVSEHLSNCLENVDNALLVNMTGIDANQTVRLRAELREKDIRLMVIKNSLARRATEGTALAPVFEGLKGPAAIMWGGEDIVSLAKEAMRLAKDKEYEPFAPRSGMMDGVPLSKEEVIDVSKWPTRGEQLSILVGQILSPGATLSGQLIGPGGALASQIEKLGEGAEDDDAEPGAAEPNAAEPDAAT